MGFFLARVLEWVAISSPGDLTDPGIEPWSRQDLKQLPVRNLTVVKFGVTEELGKSLSILH